MTLHPEKSFLWMFCCWFWIDVVDVIGTTAGTGVVSAGSIVFSTGTRALSSGIGLSNSFRGISKMKSSALFLMGMKSSKFWIRAGSLDGRASVAVCWFWICSWLDFLQCWLNRLSQLLWQRVRNLPFLLGGGILRCMRILLWIHSCDWTQPWYVWPQIHLYPEVWGLWL